MKLEQAKLVTIIADEAIEQKIIEDLRSVAVKGFTITEARGEGLNTTHNSSWEGKNIRIETLVSENKANRIIELMADKYLEKFAMILFCSDVQIYRKERFN
ncbi:P-II family nitrogen regulator [Leptospira ryugenii]|nr:hypothetical protein [Leptospira ryugenii]